MNRKTFARILILIWVILALGLYLVNGGWNRLTSKIYDVKIGMTAQEVYEIYGDRLTDVGSGMVILQYTERGGASVTIHLSSDDSTVFKIDLHEFEPFIPWPAVPVVLLAVGGVECGVYFLLRKRFPQWAPENTPQ